MLTSLFVFIASLALVAKGATLASKYAAKLASSFHLSKYTIGFILVAVISILPETFISIESAISGIPSFGLGVLLGSNVADLTLVFGIVILLAGKNVKVQSKILKNNSLYPLLLLCPIILGLDGYYSSLEGLAFIVLGSVFYYISFRNGADHATVGKKENGKLKSFAMLLLGMVLLLAGAHLTVESATTLASLLKISPILIGLIVVGLGTTMPELFFSAKSVRKKEYALAEGDILGTVLADATVVVGILALIKPFAFPPRIIYITGIFMVGASLLLLHFMRSQKELTKKEAFLLFIYWIIFVIVEFVATQALPFN